MSEIWYRLTKIPDLTLNKYASLEGRGVDGVLAKHASFLRQMNRKGIISGVSFHLFYLYFVPENKAKDMPGRRLQIYLMIRGEGTAMDNVRALIQASPLSDFYKLESDIKTGQGRIPANIDSALSQLNEDRPMFDNCVFLTRAELFLPGRGAAPGMPQPGQFGSAQGRSSNTYYMLPEWEMNEDGRLYNMCTMMEAIGRTCLYRVDLYPVERSISLRNELGGIMDALRRQQDNRSVQKDYEGRDVLKSYEDLLEKYDSSPHFIVNIMTMADKAENSLAILDAAGAESLMKGKYSFATLTEGRFDHLSFIGNRSAFRLTTRENMIIEPGSPGLRICSDGAPQRLSYLPTLFTLEEIAPFFRFPALYDGETIQIPKETAPAAVSGKGSLFLGKDVNKYDVNFPLKLLPKHAFVSGVPGSGKTNTMHHITSSLWKEHRIPFLVLEPAKSEYRALANDPKMKDLHLFSPNADMSFPLHINPFEMPKGTLVAEHIRRLCSAFEGAFPLAPPMPFLLDTAIEAVYRELGWIPEHAYTGTEKSEDGKRRQLPTMSMLYKRLEDELESTKYSDEIRGNLESALKVRIGSLLRREMGDVFDVPRSTFTPEEWLDNPAVIELESMGTGPANFMTLMLCTLIRETLKNDPKREHGAIKCSADKNGIFRCSIPHSGCMGEDGVYRFDTESFEIAKDMICGTPKAEVSFMSASGKAALRFNTTEQVFRLVFDDSFRVGYYEFDEDGLLTLFWGNRDIRHVIFIEEAHNLIGPESEEQTGEDADPKRAATAFIVKMLAEVRALKEGIFIADQLPTVMAQEVLKNTGLKIGLRITSADDRSLLGSTMAANALQLEQMATFAVGEALIFYEGLQRPFTMRIKEWWGELEDKELKAAMTTPNNDADLRELLAGRRTFMHDTRMSVVVIGSKYNRLLQGLQPKIDQWMYYLGVCEETLQKLIAFEAKLSRIVQEDREIGPEEKRKLDEAYEFLTSTRQKNLDDKATQSFMIETVEILENWALNLERLVTGRWKRSAVPDQLIQMISYVQYRMCESALNILKAMFRAKLIVKSLAPTVNEKTESLNALMQRLLDRF